MSTQPATVVKPLVRAITGFVRINRDTYEALLEDALVTLNMVKTEFESEGFEVDTVRVTTPPLLEIVGQMPVDQALTVLGKIDDLAKSHHFVFNAGPAMQHDDDDPSIMSLVEQALSSFSNIQTSVIIADIDQGIHWETIRLSADVVRYISEHSPRSQGNLRFAALAMANPYSPFYPGSYFTEKGEQFAIGLECANVVQDVLVQDKGKFASALAELTSRLSQSRSTADAVVTKVGQETPWNCAGLNLVLSSVGSISVAGAIEAYTGEHFGSPGTLTAVRMITQAMQPVDPGGNSILPFPVVEEELLARRWAENTYGIDSLLAYAAMGSTGLDAIPLPGEIHPGQLKRILSDVAVLANKWNTPLSARLVPVAGKAAGDRTDFNDPSFVNTTVHALP